MACHRKYSRRKHRGDRSLIKFAAVLYALFGLMCFPKHFSKFSRHDFTARQLLALCIVCTKSKQSPEDFCEQFLPATTKLVEALDLRRLPTPSTLRKFARRLKTGWAHTALVGCAELAGLRNICADIDGTGHSKLRGSKHYYKRVGRRVKRKDFVKVVGVDDLTTQLVLTVRIRKKARHDNVDFRPTVNRVARITTLDTLIGDKAFDVQKNHDVTHQHCTLLITPVRNADVLVWRTKGTDRKRLKRHFPTKKYHKRSKKETVWGVVKQMFGDAVRATTFRMQKIELLFRYLAYNIDRILKLQKKRNIASAFSDELKITLVADAA